MLDNVVIGRYIETNSRLTRFHPFLKLWILLICSIIIGIFDNVYILGCLTLFIIWLIQLTKIPIKWYVKTINSIKLLLILTFVTTLIFHQNIELSLIMIIKFIDLVLLGSIYLYTTKLRDILIGIELFIYPLRIFKIDWQEISFIIFLSIRFISVVIMIADQVIKSLICRGIDYYQNFYQRIKAFPIVLYPIIIKTLNTTNEFADTILLRYPSIPKDRKLKIENWQKRDSIVFINSLLIVIILIVNEV